MQKSRCVPQPSITHLGDGYKPIQVQKQEAGVVSGCCVSAARLCGLAWFLIGMV